MATTYAQSIITTGINFGQDTLDYYEEGTFTPSVFFGGGSAGITYTTQDGKYTREGNTVTINMFILLSNKGALSGNAVVVGLPFSALPSGSQMASVYHSNLTYTGTASGIYSTTSIALRDMASGTATVNLTDAAFVNSTSLVITGTYLIA